MNNAILRIPYIAQLIFEEVDDKTLVNCKTVSETWVSFIGMKKIEWLRIILKYAGNMTEFADHWKLLLRRIPVKLVKEIALTVTEFFSANPKRKDFQWSPFVIAADRGHQELYQYTLDKLHQIDLAQLDQIKALAFATMGDHLEVCKLIIANLAEKSPRKEMFMMTPLHCAARCGNLELFQLLSENTSDKNPRCNFGWTPLHVAAAGGYLNWDLIFNTLNYNGMLPIDITTKDGHAEICKFLIVNIADKNPGNMNGTSALHMAAFCGQLEAYKLIMQSVADKNPQNHFGQTPLHIAAEAGKLEICRLIIDSVADKNPGYVNGRTLSWTPLHEAAKSGHLEVCKLIIKNIDEVIDKEDIIDLASKYGHIKLCRFLINGEEDSKYTSNPVSQLFFIIMLTFLFPLCGFDNNLILNFYIVIANCLYISVLLGPYVYVTKCLSPLFFVSFTQLLDSVILVVGGVCFIIGTLVLYIPLLIVIVPLLRSYLMRMKGL